MVHIFYASFQRPLSAACFRDYQNGLPVYIAKKIRSYRRWEDAHASLFGKLLLMHGLKFLSTGESIANLRYNAYGRPFFLSGADFNISHSGKFVICAISLNHRVGIDIEEIRPVSVEDFASQWLPAENEDIIRSSNQIWKFYYYWTRKESVIKASGEGLSIPLDLVDVTTDIVRVKGDTWFLSPVDIHATYICHLALSSQTDNIVSHEVNFDLPAAICDARTPSLPAIT